MGHIASSKNSLIPLIDRLNKYPIGLVDNEILREILSLLFSETEALVASKFPLHEATLTELSKRTQMSGEELLSVLDSMAEKGLIMDMPYNGTTYYLLMPGVIGFFEFTFMKHRSDLPLEKIAKLMTEYFYQDPANGQRKEFFGSKTQLTRSLVYDEHIPLSSVITPYESAKEIIERSDFGAAGMCYCRHKRQHEGKECNKGMPVEGTCIALGNGARFLSRRGFAKEKTKAELLEIIDLAHSLNLTHITDNIRNKPTFICNCCGCCCEIMAGIKKGYFDGVAKTSFIATVNTDLCDYCGDCFTACNVKAIGLDKTKTFDRSKRVCAVNPKICLGCGACISTCDKNAISLIPRRRPQVPKKTKRDLFKSILIQKGRLTPFIVDIIKTKIKKLLTGHLFLKPRILVDPNTLSENTLRMMDNSMENFKKGNVSQPVDVDKYLKQESDNNYRDRTTS